MSLLLFFKDLINIKTFFLVLISNVVNIGRYNPHKEKLFGTLSKCWEWRDPKAKVWEPPS